MAENGKDEGEGKGEDMPGEKQKHRAKDSVADKVSRVGGGRGGRERRGRTDSLRDLLEVMQRSREAGGGMPMPDEMSEQRSETFGSNFRNDLIRRWQLLDKPDSSDEIAKVQQRIDKFLKDPDPYKILSARKEYIEFEKTLTSEQKGQFESVISVPQKDLINNNAAEIDNKFTKLTRKLKQNDTSLDPVLTYKELEARVKDIRDRAAYELGAIKNRWHSLEQAQALIISAARSKIDYKGEEGIRAWIAFKEITKIQAATEIHERFQVKTDPIENIHTAEEVMRFFEQSKSPETFRIASQQLTELQQVVVNSQDARITESMKEQFRKRTEAFITVNTLIFSSISSEGNPAALHKIALEQFNDETWEYYFSRFTPDSLKDKEGNSYLEDKDGKPVDVNIVGEALNVFAEQYLEDRFRMNIIEELSKGELSNGKLGFNNLTKVEKETLIQLAKSIKENTELRELVFIDKDNNNEAVHFNEVADIDLDNLINSYDILNKVWRNPGAKTLAIKGWFEENTLLGADRYEDIVVGEGENQSKVNVLRKDKWQEMVMTGKLRNRLVKLGVDKDRIISLMGSVEDFDKRLILIGSEKEGQEEFQKKIGDFELLTAIKRNGFELAKLFYSDTLDRIRIFDGKKHHITIFGEDTPYLSRSVSHMMDVAVLEKIGDDRVNKLVIDFLNEKSGTVLLPQNLTAIRMLWQRKGVLLDKDLRESIDKQVRNKMVEQGASDDMDVSAAVQYKFLQTGLDPTREKVNRDLEKITEINWVKGSKEMKSYEMHDMYDDRQKAFKWYQEKFKMWTLHPTGEEFFSMIGEYYSMRNVRRHPGAGQYLEMMYEVGQHWKEWFGYKDNLPDATYEAYVQRFRENNWIDEERADKLKNEVLGREPVRSARQLRGLSWEAFKQTLGSPGWWSGSILDFFKTLFQYLSKQ